MLTAKNSEIAANHIGCANALHLTYRHGHTDARTAHQNATLSSARLHVFANLNGEIGIIYTVVAIGATIDNLVAFALQVSSKLLLLFEASVIRCDRDLHDAFSFSALRRHTDARLRSPAIDNLSTLYGRSAQARLA